MKYLKNQLLVTVINFIAILYVNCLWQGGVRLPINRFCSQVFADYQAIKSLDAKKIILELDLLLQFYILLMAAMLQ